MDQRQSPLSYACDVALDIAPDGLIGVATNSHIPIIKQQEHFKARKVYVLEQFDPGLDLADACLLMLVKRLVERKVPMATWEEYLATQQNVDGVQFTWNMWPHSRVDAQRLVVPVSCFFTPLKRNNAGLATTTLFSYVDFRAKSWVCPFCNQRNPFPAHYAAIAEDNRPPELYPQFTTIEYTLK
ncbi:Sec23/Sec24 zinc finger, partial [Oesophagostomum dentatum]